MTIIESQNVVCQEVTSPIKGAREVKSLLGPVGRGMRLKVSRAATSASQVVELASRKCLVGAAPSCDLRVDEPGVAPIECLIFHGAEHDIVRWFDAAQGFASVELFEDEVLHAGDPLQIGPVELEVLIDEIMATEEPSGNEEMSPARDGRLADYIARLERLEDQFVELRQSSDAAASLSDADDLQGQMEATITSLAAQLADLQSRSVTDRELWAGEKAEFEVLLKSRLRQVDLLQDEIRCLRDELVTVRGEFDQASTDDDADERFAAVSKELAARAEAFEQEQAIWEGERNEFQRHLQANTERLTQFETQLNEQRLRQAESEAARQAAEARADRLQASVDELSNRLAEQQQEYERVRAEWETDRASLELELADTQDRLARASATETSQEELHEAWESQRSVLQSQIEETSSRLELAQEELEAHREHLQEQPSRLDPQPEEDTFAQASEEIAFEAAPSEPPVSTADVLARLGHSGAWDEDDSGELDSNHFGAAASTESLHDDFAPFEEPETVGSQDEPPQDAPVCETPFAPPRGTDAGDSDDGEESIEAYMTRLMSRVRATDPQDEMLQRAEPVADRSPVTEYTEVTTTVPLKQAPKSAKINPEEYKPRTQAPELADRMTAMRSLANDSARSAIASHAKRNWSSVVKLKLLVSVFAFVAVVASNIFFWGNPPLMGLGSLVGLGVLAYWAHTAVTYRKLLLESLMLEPESGHDDAE